MSKDYLWWITRHNTKFIGDFLLSIPPNDDYEIIVQKTGGKPLAWAWNQGLKRLVDYKAIIICNDDITVKPDTGKVITDVLNKVGRKTKTLAVSAYDINRQQDVGNVWIPSNLLYPGSFCFAVDERLSELIGEFDERFWPFLFEDTDMFYRIKKAGYDWATSVPVWHYGSGSITTPKMVEWRNKYFEQNKLIYIEKWGGVPGEEKYEEPHPREMRIDRHS